MGKRGIILSSKVGNHHTFIAGPRETEFGDGVDVFHVHQQPGLFVCIVGHEAGHATSDGGVAIHHGAGYSYRRSGTRSHKFVEQHVYCAYKTWCEAWNTSTCVYRSSEGTRAHTHTRMHARTHAHIRTCLLYTSPSPRDQLSSRMPSSA